MRRLLPFFLLNTRSPFHIKNKNSYILFNKQMTTDQWKTVSAIVSARVFSFWEHVISFAFFYVWLSLFDWIHAFSRRKKLQKARVYAVLSDIDAPSLFSRCIEKRRRLPIEALNWRATLVAFFIAKRQRMFLRSQKSSAYVVQNFVFWVVFFGRKKAARDEFFQNLHFVFLTKRNEKTLEIRSFLKIKMRVLGSMSNKKLTKFVQ